MKDQSSSEVLKPDGVESKRPFLGQVLIDGKYTPSVRELAEILPKLDLRNQFKDVKGVDTQNGYFTLSFDSLENARLFALVLGVEALRRELFYFSPSERFFESKAELDLRLDGNQFSYSENIVDNRTEVSLFIRYS